MARSLSWSLLMSITGIVGIFVLICGIAIRSRSDPTSVTWEGNRWQIERREQGKAVLVDFIRNSASTADLSLAGSTDLVCDVPWLAWFDVDGDAQNDVYFRHCGGHGFVKYYHANLEYVQLGSSSYPPALRSLLFVQIQHGAIQLIAAGVIASFAAMGGFVGAWIWRRWRTPRVSTWERHK